MNKRLYVGFSQMRDNGDDETDDGGGKGGSDGSKIDPNA